MTSLTSTPADADAWTGTETRAERNGAVLKNPAQDRTLAKMGTARGRVLFLLPAGFSLRNVVHSGLLDRLLPAADGALLVPKADPEVKAS